MKSKSEYFINVFFIVVFIFSCSAVPLTIYNNARFESNISDWFWRNFSHIVSRDQCACQCYFDQWCLTASYSAADQQCSMFSARLYEGQMYVVPTSRQLDVLYFTNKTLLPLSRLTSTNETVYGIWNTTTGGDSWPSFLGNSTGCYFPNEEPKRAFDQLNGTKYTNFGVCNSTVSGPQCGLNTGLYLTLQRGRSLLLNVRFCTGNNVLARDPFTVTIEGSNQPSIALPQGSSWSLIYSGSTGLQNVTSREQCGANQTLQYNYLWYNSYRILITSKRGNDHATQYSEVELFGY